MVVDFFKDLLWGNLIEAALGKLFAASPFLAWAPVKVFIIWIVKKYSEELYDVSSKYFAIREIVINDEHLKKEFDRESVKLKIIARDHGIESEEFRSARAQSREHLSQFGRFNVAR